MRGWKRIAIARRQQGRAEEWVENSNGILLNSAGPRKNEQSEDRRRNAPRCKSRDNLPIDGLALAVHCGAD